MIYDRRNICCDNCGEEARYGIQIGGIHPIEFCYPCYEKSED